MKSNQADIIYYANPQSVHVKRWLELNARLNNSLTVYAIFAHRPAQIGATLKSRFFKFIPKTIQYVLCGLYQRFFSKKAGALIHAHNASGYGLMALLSGHKFILTTYGSEIFSYKSKGPLYYYFLKKTLEKARLITTTTASMAAFLVTEFGLPKEKIKAFSLGVPSDFSSAKMQPVAKTENFFADNTATYLFSNRRITSLYRIDFIVSEVIAMLASGIKNIRLVLLAGDYDYQYLDHIKKMIHQSGFKKHFLLIDNFITVPNLVWLFDKVTYSISLAKTDQLSSSILESIYMGAVPILNNLSAYSTINALGACFIIDSFEKGALKRALNQLGKQEETIKQQVNVYKKSFLQEDYILPLVRSIYNYS